MELKDARRPCAAVALLALLAATGCSNESTGPSQVVATVGDSEVTESQVNQVLERQTALKPDELEAASRKAVSELVDQEMILHKARDAKLDRDQRVVQLLETAKRDILTRAYLDRIADGAAKPQAKDVQAYYDENPALFAKRRIYTFQEFIIEAADGQQAQIEARVAAVKSASELDAFLKSLKITSTSKTSTIAPENIPMPLLQRVGSLAVGQGLVLRVKGGLRILLLLSTKDAPVAEEQARTAIDAFLVARNKRASVEHEMEALRSAGKVAYFGRYADLAASAASASGPGAAASDTTGAQAGRPLEVARAPERH